MLFRSILKYSYIKISIECQSKYQILNYLEAGDIDIGLVAKPTHLRNLHYYPMGEIEDIFVASKHYINRLKRESSFNETEDNILDHATLMLLDKGNITRQHIDYFLKEQQIAINNIIEVTSMDLLIDFAKIGIGVSCVIKDIVKDELENESLIELPQLCHIPKREIGFVCNSKDRKSTGLNSGHEIPSRMPSLA